jgi:TatA/E family protein of Tat protein translocase
MVVLATLGPWQVLILVVVIVLLFGTARFGRAFRGLVRGGKEFKRELKGGDDVHPPSDSS